MKIKIFATTLMLSMLTSFHGIAAAQNVNQVNIAANVQETEEIKNIQKLLEITGSKNLFQQVTSQMVNNIKPNFPQVPQKLWDSFQQELNYDEVVAEMIPIYQKYFTNKEITEMIAFYETPLGKKTISVMPKLMQDSVQIGQTYGQKVAERVLKKLESEGYFRRP
jgi:hypothetical protein